MKVVPIQTIILIQERNNGKSGIKIHKHTKKESPQMR